MEQTKKEKREDGFPYVPAPRCEPIFGQPKSCFEMVNRYGTYNVQPTMDSGQTFPLIAHGLGKRQNTLRLRKEDVQKLSEIE